jgi:hypothetical protein
MTTADDIPVAHTPPGGWRGAMPPPILGGCTQRLADGAPDLRGTWNAVAVEIGGTPMPDHPLNAHVERIEQCGDRVVITSEPIIHDMRADGTLEHGVDDVAAANLDQRMQVAALFCDGRLELHLLGIVAGRPPIVTRELVDGRLLWRYGPFTVTCERVDA